MQEPKIQVNGKEQTFKVIPKDSVDKSVIRHNVRKNLEMIPPSQWIQITKGSPKTIHIFSGGPSLDTYLKNNKPDLSDGIVVCVKHALPILARHSIEPDFCVALDPRPITGTSTHGFKRQDLYKTAPKRTRFLVASMAEPSGTKYLLDQGYEVWGWHCHNSALMDMGLPKGTFMVTGGTCSAMRAIALFYTLGFRKFKLYGYDSCVWEKTLDYRIDQAKQLFLKHAPGILTKSFKKPNQKYFNIEVGGKKYLTTGELVALYQDFVHMMKNMANERDVEIEVITDGLCKAAYDQFMWDYNPLPEFEQIFPRKH